MRSNLKEKTIELNLFSQKIIRRKFKDKDKEKIEKPKKKRRKPNILDLWHKKDLLHRVIPIILRFFLDIIRAVRWDKLFVEVDVATPDPALTGVLYGGLCVVKGSTDYFLPHAHIKLRPDFFNQFPRGSTEAIFTTRLFSILGPVSRMFFALPKIQIVKTYLIIKRR